ncbi:sugar phosphate nucleotidyltransferase [Pelagicoccus sp. SDUM812003]|uniref:mannose-1-phosphate guanylyltransferase n=1 Tax=Pelagicoccus sp. SDUM812003 TaxID=3041267 RepID=UPI00280E387A|nr:sugar phosphate nucleotidyltransferase [Pelagicoccus sp. SDUM812003]MDQ8203328.1 sugar phosphate nucleotidyltransferase [Pelagicoccus sp. SDUM812003]
MVDRYAVIMAGGKGERFWPASRLARPKHLLPIVGEKPMLTQTVERLEGFLPYENVIIITNSEQLDGVREVCPMLPEENIVAEPVGRDTAAAVGLAMLLVKQRNPDAAMAMLPADALINDKQSFQSALEIAFKAAESSPSLLTIGIQPTEPATGYGYIQCGTSEKVIDNRDIFAVRQFKEKPDLETAKSYLQSGDYFWNAGMFVWKVSTISDALEEFTPTLKKGLDQIEAGMNEGKELIGLLSELYPKLEKISVDFAIMEKATNVQTLAATFDWDDVGAWPAIARHFPSDKAGNVNKGPVKFSGCSKNIVVTDKDHLVALIGVEDLIVVHVKDATLICSKDKAQKIKELVRSLGEEEAYKALL